MSSSTPRPKDRIGHAQTAAQVWSRATGWVVLKLKTPWRDGIAHLVTSPLEFMQ